MDTFITSSLACIGAMANNLKINVDAWEKFGFPRSSYSPLIHNLPDLGIKSNKLCPEGVRDLSAMIRSNDAEMVIILGTSGSGKTRECFELLTEEYGLYFSCFVGNDFVGSSDMQDAIESLEAKIVTGSLDTNLTLVGDYIPFLLFSRLYVLSALLDRGMSRPSQWLAVQLLDKGLFTNLGRACNKCSP